MLRRFDLLSYGPENSKHSHVYTLANGHISCSPGNLKCNHHILCKPTMVMLARTAEQRRQRGPEGLSTMVFKFTPLTIVILHLLPVKLQGITL